MFIFFSVSFKSNQSGVFIISKNDIIQKARELGRIGGAAAIAVLEQYFPVTAGLLRTEN